MPLFILVLPAASRLLPYICRMEINLNTPALLFPAISLLLLAYTNRFLAIANVVRKLHEDYTKNNEDEATILQIRNLRKRLRYIRLMQGAGVFSFLLCVVCMYSIYNGWMLAANFIFATSLLSLLFSLLCSLIEIFLSLNALEVLLKNIGD
jgi:hypothetical protein